MPPKPAKVIAYCMKCHEQREMKDPKDAITANGRKMLKGTCIKCGAKMNVFVKG